MKSIFKLIILCFLYFGSHAIAISQEQEIYIKKHSGSWNEFVKETEKKFDVRFFYRIDSLKNEPFIVHEKIALIDALKANFSKKGFFISKDNNGNYFIFKDFELDNNIKRVLNEEDVHSIYDNLKEKGESEYLKSYKKFISESIIIGKNGNSGKHKWAKISGFVKNSSDNSPIPNARIKINETNTNVITNFDGFYEVRVKPGDYTLVASSLGMSDKSYKIHVVSNGTLNIPLQTKSILLDEALITATFQHNVKSTTMGYEKITAKALKEIPVVLGEQDVVKVALLLPGVQTVSEISSGFNVRGSPADQNMFYINSLPIYNSSHLFGLYTTFNSDAIKEFDFYKSNIPVEYGGHLSSIFNISTKQGDKNNFSARGGIGPLSGKVLVEGPILRDSSSSFLVSLRSTYSDWLLKQVDNLDIQNSSASFYDFLFNTSFNIGAKNKINLFVYASDDKSDLAFGMKNNYQNQGATIKWSHFFSRRFVSELSLVKSRYAYTLENRELDYLAYKNSFGLNHDELKLKFKLNLTNTQQVQFGVNSKLYHLNYGDFLPADEYSSIQPISFEPEKGMTNSLFLTDKWDISNKLSFEAGLRGTNYTYLGPKTVYNYAENQPRDINSIIDTTSYGNNSFIHNNWNLDYRIAGKFQITRNFSVKASYNTLHQYIFMLSNSITVSPTNKWKLSDQHIKPMKGSQYSLGLYKNFINDKYETSVEVYYKDIENQVEYKDGAEFLTNPIIETSLIQGNLRSSGIEFMFKKKSGKLNGWINYTYSRSMIEAINLQTGEMNNNGIAYPANYDRPHALNLTMNYKLSKRINISSNIVYSTGRPITLPAMIYYHDGIQVTGFSERNAYRLPDYFRTDLSINIEGNLKKNKWAHSSWSIGIYNLTGRKNPYTMTFENEDGVIKAYKISILGSIIPSINYNLKFGNYEN